MKKIFTILIGLVTLISFNVFAGENIYNEAGFQKWLMDFKIEAVKKHKIKQDVLNYSFKNVHYIDKVIKLDNFQPEFNRSFYDYIDNAITKKRVSEGNFNLQNYKTLLKNVYNEFEIPPEIIISFWGLETYYGKIRGEFNIIESLASLAYSSRRKDFFKKELIFALKILNRRDMTNSQLYGSWAGAFGHFQFMPSTFTSYAVDGNRDGFKNLTGDIMDAMYSAGNYLSKMGWNSKLPWGVEVFFDVKISKIWELADKDEWLPISEFLNAGVKVRNAKKYPMDSKVKLITPAGCEGPKFLVFENFKYITSWNNSINYAVAVGLLSDVIKENKSLKMQRPKNWKSLKTFSHSEIEKVQKKLKELGFYDAKETGFYGKVTAKAIREFQKSLLKKTLFYKNGTDIILDGYLSIHVYNELFN